MIAMIRQQEMEDRSRALRDAEGTHPSSFSHVPVLKDAVLQALMPAPGKFFVDGTLGGGGHAQDLLDAGAFVLGIDQDPEAIAHASQKLSSYGPRFRAVHASFGDVDAILRDLKLDSVDGALLDLGVSSHQLDTPLRGFSFQSDGPLDMRMNTHGPVTARDLVNTASAEQLERIFREFGEEPNARRIATRIARDRAVKPLNSTLDLARCVESIVPRQGKKTHPATRVFQALRIAVNRELEVLIRGLEGFSSRLAPGGRFAVITFHSLEDRLVKQFFQHRSSPSIDRPEWSAPRANPDYCFKKITGKPLVACDAEQRFNARSRSAKLRVVERLPLRRETAFPSHPPP
jgi:16S rRNA (cytosine1402-N4)-methyltransferase